jgi:hypothetical protein
MFDGYSIISQSPIRKLLEIVLRNLGKFAIAPEVRAEIVPREDAIIAIVNNMNSFGDILPDGIGTNTTPYIIDTNENQGELYLI